MKVISKVLTKQEISGLKKKYGHYFKIIVDLENEILVAGGELHADGEKLLLEEGSRSENIWGGSINLKTKTIDMGAVLNLRPRLDNQSMEILDPERRKNFIRIVKKIFASLWD